MFVKNIVKTSAEYLGLKDVVKFLNSEVEATEQVLEEIENFVLAVNMVNNNIASSYVELLSSAEVDKVGSLIKYTDITDKSIIEIKKIESYDGASLNFKLLPEGVVVEGASSCVVEYSYFPTRVGIDDEITHFLKVNELVFSLGVVGEYLYIKGAIDDAYMWDKRFKSSMFNLLRPRRNIEIPARRWE